MDVENEKILKFGYAKIASYGISDKVLKSLT